MGGFKFARQFRILRRLLLLTCIFWFLLLNGARIALKGAVKNHRILHRGSEKSELCIT